MLVLTPHQYRDLLRSNYPRLVAIAILATGVVTLHHLFGINVAISGMPVSALGTAVAFYVGFKNNQAYDRFWEGRKIWGSILNNTRSWSAGILDFLQLPDDLGQRPDQQAISPEQLTAIKQELLYRHLAWVNLLRMQLRGQTNWQAEISSFLDPAELQDLNKRPNPAAYLLRTQSRRIEQLAKQGLVSGLAAHLKLRDGIQAFYDQQGMCERIRNTPLVPHYTLTATIFVWLYIVLVPFSLLDALAGEAIWASIPIAALVGWVFDTMDQIGKKTENPFSNSPMDVPMSSMCRNMEIEIRDLLNETDLPKPLTAVNGVLM